MIKKKNFHLSNLNLKLRNEFNLNIDHNVKSIFSQSYWDKTVTDFYFYSSMEYICFKSIHVNT